MMERCRKDEDFEGVEIYEENDDARGKKEDRLGFERKSDGGKKRENYLGGNRVEG